MRTVWKPVKTSRYHSEHYILSIADALKANKTRIFVIKLRRQQKNPISVKAQKSKKISKIRVTEAMKPL